MPEVPKIRKKKQLEIFLEKVPDFPKPDPKLEQYKTPAPVAADILFNAYSSGDIADRSVLDTCCGTGMFAIGAKILGAETVFGIDIDLDAVALVRDFAYSYELEIDLEVMDVNDLDHKCDTVIQNPPFGSQTKKADRIFLETAVKSADVIYSIHNTRTVEFIRLMAGRLGCQLEFEKNYIFDLKHTFDFHTKPKAEYEVTLFKFITEKRETRNEKC